ncbi:MAG: peptidase M23 family protein [Parcubacteria group bacterium Gr01-1014_49]|nr:MAG: peptidase M23 family protein [Parcubacteria group bacterium Gr01-1014_49]
MLPNGTGPDIYKVCGQCALLIAGFALIALATASLPEGAHAFWPFSTNADAAVNASLPDSRTPLLAAATNLDPNPDKGLGDSQTMSDNALVASGGPSGTTADVVGTTPPDRISVYVVRSGDTLSDIASMFEVSINTIIWANNLSSVRDVHPGDTLIILPVSGVQRTIVKGDTLKSIAKKYGADANEIAQFNGLDPKASLEVGSTIIIPGGEIASPVSKSSSRKIGKEPYLGGGGTAFPGYYSNPIPGSALTQGLHGWNGIDLGAARGTPIRAAADGTVIIARSNGAWNGGYGNYVVITHGNGSQTLYSHMKNAIVSSGQFVSSGQIIGYVGSTGLSTGPHLHFEVRGAANPFRNCSIGRFCAPQ